MMSDLHRLLRPFGRVDSTGEFKAISYRHDSKSTVLAISNWQRLPEYHHATVIQFIVSDEDGFLEWTLTAERSQLPGVVQLVLPVTPSSHRLAVQMKLLIEGTTSRGTAATPVAAAAAAAAADTKCYENLHEVSCKVEHSNPLAQTQLRSDHFKDFRPRLRENVGIGSRSNAEMTVLAAFDSVLPMTDSSIFNYDDFEDSLQFVFYEGKDKDVYCRRRLFKLSLSRQPRLSLQSLTREREITAKFGFTEDGTLIAVINEGLGNADQCYSPQILDVIGRKLPTNTTEPTLTVAGLRENHVELRISTTYSTSELEKWQITLTPHSKSAGTYSKSSIFVVPVTGFEQSFQIPMETVKDGTEYGIKVDGLQACDPGAKEKSVAFKVVCSNSTTAKLDRPARAQMTSLDELLGDMRLANRTPQTPISLSTRTPEAQTFSLEKLRRHLLLGNRTPQTPVSSSTLVPEAARATPLASRLIEIERRTFHQATAVISYNSARYSANAAAWKITISKIASATAPVLYSYPQEFSVQATGGTEQRYDIPLQFLPGHSYAVQVEGFGLKETTRFRAELTISDLRALHSMAKRHTAGQGSSPCFLLYRNKSYDYFDNIVRNEGGMMRVYDKDNSGDPASPINLQIKGLFFMATVQSGSIGQPMRDSAFGPVRICIDAEEMLRRAPNLYFADYYCMRGQNHQVTLVMTKPGSPTDRFCEPRLLKLDVNDTHDNPFFFRDIYGQLQVSRAYHLMVELLFTEDLDISRYPRTITPTVGKGSSTKGGIPKNALCQQCNLRGSSGYPKF